MGKGFLQPEDLRLVRAAVGSGPTALAFAEVSVPPTPTVVRAAHRMSIGGYR
jgi:hypothetical protein